MKLEKIVILGLMLMMASKTVLAAEEELVFRNIIYENKLFCSSKNIINWSADFLKYCEVHSNQKIQLYIDPDKKNFELLQVIRKSLVRDNYDIEIIRLEGQVVRAKLDKCMSDINCRK